MKHAKLETDLGFRSNPCRNSLSTEMNGAFNIPQLEIFLQFGDQIFFD
jgi:hypothetical protein